MAGPGPDQRARRAAPTPQTRTPERPPSARERERVTALEAVVEDLGAELSLRPLLERILERSIQLLEGDAGSISLVDEAAGVYRKEADIGVACQSGGVFPLSEGVTGAVVARRGSVAFGDYGEVRGGHVPEADRATLRAVIGVPIWWGPSIIGSCVVFSRDGDRTFDDDDATLLELFAKHAALAITYARLHESAEANARAEAAAEERNRMAREVHDTVAKGLVSVLLQLRSAEGALDAGRADELRGAIDEAATAARFALDETRRSVLGLAPSPVAGSSLEEALERELAWANRTGSADVRLVVAGEPVPLRAEVAHSLFRIAQEALTNALHHAEAGSVRIGIVYAERGVTLLVQDDGEGFDLAEVERAGALHGMGLRGMAERARLLGGTVDVESTPGWGTRVRAELPHPGGADDARRRRPRAAADRRRPRGHPRRDVPPDRRRRADDRGGGPRGLRARGAGAVARPAPGRGADGPAHARRRRGGDDRPHPRRGSGRRHRRPDCLRPRRAGDRGPARRRARLPGQGRLGRRPRPRRPRGRPRRGRAVGRRGAARPRPLNGAPELSEREREVLGLLERGLPDRRIAAALSISVKTVEKHVGAILRKTGAQNRTEAALRGRERALR